ncbi:transcription factor GTE4 isoform X2 [Lactuca sativa]|nr:transcription factor GTE4 isoform X2 [Lactuca sativa]XP_052623404.1 transcription factor GTE4 isoform X2 [Lactuca sativa]
METVVPNGNGIARRPIVTLVDDRVKIYLEASTPKNEIKEVRAKFKAELDRVRSLFQKLEDKEAEITDYSTNLATSGNDETYTHSQYPGNVPIDRRTLLRVNSEMGTDYMDRRALSRVHSEIGPDVIDRRALMRVNSEIGPLSNQETTQTTRFRPPLNISILDNSLGTGEFVEKEKRTPKANQYYRNSEFLLGKDRLPPETNKRSKSNNGRKYNRESDYTIGLERHKNQVFRNCSNLLQRLMKHKHGWVFNEPVNAKLLGLHDYHDIIKHPMDFGTIKSRLAQNFYKTPGEFAEDVRLTFHNAMTYNPQGQDVHVMAEQLSNIFEERWEVIESDWRNGTSYDTNSRKVQTQVNNFPHAPMSLPFLNRQKPSNLAPVSRTPVPKKPKAKDLNKRNMTYEEKQKLSANLQSLPSEKLDNIVQIIKKSNTSLSQHDDEIEVDIDSVDIETLWELDRFVTNYKKSLSKHRRKAELAQQARSLGGNVNRTIVQNPTKSIPEGLKDKKADEKNVGNSPPTNQGDVNGDNVSRSSSSSSSSSDSGSSSSDSDSDSSSADGSDAGR